MIATNKKTGKDITGLVIEFLETKITKKEFEKRTGLNKKSKLKDKEQ